MRKPPDCCGHPFDEAGRWFTCQKCGLLYHFEGIDGPIMPWEFWAGILSVAFIALGVVFFGVIP